MVFSGLRVCPLGRKTTMQTTVVKTPANRGLNRFRNITACESTYVVYLKKVSIDLPCLHQSVLIPFGTDDDHRVVLKSISGGVDCEHKYINAAYVDVSFLKIFI